MSRFAAIVLAIAVAALLAAANASGEPAPVLAHHVYPSQDIQQVLETAARNPTNKTVLVHAGTYRPSRPGQALLWFNRHHDGIRLLAEGKVILTAANPDLANPSQASHPAVVNHVVYFGDGITDRTLLKGFTITGAKDYFSTNGAELVEPNAALEKGLFFYGDGGAIKVFGRSYPVIEGVELVDNFASPCAGGISIEHTGHGAGTSPKPVTIRDCVFRNNRAQVNGAALDLLLGSYAVVSNCLFVGNVGNLGFNYVTDPSLPPLFTNAAVLCVFPEARIHASHCTLTGNRNGVHDMGNQSAYEHCILVDNAVPGGFYNAPDRYEMRIDRRARVNGCLIQGGLIDPLSAIDAKQNSLNPPPPRFDPQFHPQSEKYQAAGYRAVSAGTDLSRPVTRIDLLEK